MANKARDESGSAAPNITDVQGNLQHAEEATELFFKGLNRIEMRARVNERENHDKSSDN